MALKTEIKGNFFRITETTKGWRLINQPAHKLTYDRTKDDIFVFRYADSNIIVGDFNSYQGQMQGVEGIQYNLEDTTDTIKPKQPVYYASEIVDSAGIAIGDVGAQWATVDDFDDWLSTRLGSQAAGGGGGVQSVSGDIVDNTDPVNPIIRNEGIDQFFIRERGNIGFGLGWADTGFITDLPVLFFDNILDEKATYPFFALDKIVLTDVNPTVDFLIYTTGLPVVATTDQVRWQLECRYIEVGEKATKVPDETLLQTQTLTQLATNTRQDTLSFTLDRALMHTAAELLFTLTRLPGDAADTYDDDIAVGQAGIEAEAKIYNT